MRHRRSSEATPVGTRAGRRRSRWERNLQGNEPDKELEEGDCTWGKGAELTQQHLKGTAKRCSVVFFSIAKAVSL